MIISSCHAIALARRRLVGSLIELIPPVHQRVYKMGMEHFGVVVGEGVELRKVIELQGGRFDGIHHVEGWVPQRLVTATGPNPLPR